MLQKERGKMNFIFEKLEKTRLFFYKKHIYEKYKEIGKNSKNSNFTIQKNQLWTQYIIHKFYVPSVFIHGYRFNSLNKITLLYYLTVTNLHFPFSSIINTSET